MEVSINLEEVQWERRLLIGGTNANHDDIRQQY